MNKIIYKNFLQNINKKKIFLVEVFCTLIFQIIVAFVVLIYSEMHEIIHTKMHLIGIIIVLFATIIIIQFIQSPLLKFLLFTFFSACIGLLLSYRFDIHNKEENEIVKKSFITTIITFIYIVVFGFFLSFFGIQIPYQISIFLFFALLLLIIVIFVMSISGKYELYHRIIAGFVIFLFTCFILYDTINMLDKNYYGDFISASLDYFLDFINLFSGILNISD